MEKLVRQSFLPRKKRRNMWWKRYVICESEMGGKNFFWSGKIIQSKIGTEAVDMLSESLRIRIPKEFTHSGFQTGMSCRSRIQTFKSSLLAFQNFVIESHWNLANREKSLFRCWDLLKRAVRVWYPVKTCFVNFIFFVFCWLTTA